VAVSRASTRRPPTPPRCWIKPGYRWDGHQPGQYLRIGIDIEGVRHWRAYSLTSDPEREDGCISITVKNVDEGKVSPFLVRGCEPGTIVGLGGVEGGDDRGATVGVLRHRHAPAA